MINNKKGLSTVVTTLIIILLVLVAIGIIWIVVRNVIETGAETTNYAVKCLEVDIRVSDVPNSSCTSTCNVTLTRKAGGDLITGVKIVFHNETGGTTGSVNTTVVSIDPLTSQTLLNIPTGVTNPAKVEVTPYFTGDSGDQQVCTQTNSFSF